MNESEIIDWLHFFEFWMIKKSSTGRYMVTIGPVYDSTATGSKTSYETIYSRKNEKLCDLIERFCEADADIQRTAFSNTTKNTTLSSQLHEENAKLREALKQARRFASDNHYTMRQFAEYIGITPTQLSAWTDEVPDREPDFKD